MEGGLQEELRSLEDTGFLIAAGIAEMIAKIEREVEISITEEFDRSIYDELVIHIDGPGHIWVDQQAGSDIPTWTLAYIHGIVESTVERYMDDIEVDGDE